MRPFPHPHGGRDPGDERDGPPDGELPRKLRLAPIRLILGDLPVRLSSRPLDSTVATWTAAPARRPLRSVLGLADCLDLAPVSLAGAMLFVAFCWRTRRDRLAVAVTLAVVAMVACVLGLRLLLAPVHAAIAGGAAAKQWTASGRALAAMAVGWTVAFVLLRRDPASWSLAIATLCWPIVAGVLRVVGGGTLATSVVAGWAAGIAMAACAAALWLADRRRGTRLA